MEKPKSLVTGACGFMGTHMVEVLHKAGHEVIATDLRSACEKDDKERGRFPSVLRNLGIEPRPSDMTQSESLKELVEDVDYVFHIAAIFNYSVPWEALYNVNVEGTRHLCEYLLKHPKLKRIVVWGAGGVYGYPTPDMLPLKEDTRLAPPNDYLKSKHLQEQLVMEMGLNKGLPYTIMRPTGVYGPRAVYGGGQMIMDPAQMDPLAAPCNFTGRVPLVHVADVCNAALFLAQNEDAQGEIYNLNDDSMYETKEFMKIIAEIRNHKYFEIPVPVPLGAMRLLLGLVANGMKKVTDVVPLFKPPLEYDTVQFLGRDFTYSNTKLKKLGYKFIYPDARDGIRDTIDWYVKEGWIK